MTKQGYIKLVLKVLNVNTNKVEWTHFCYVDKELYNKYLADTGIVSNDLNGIISRWSNEDFGIDISMSSSTDIHLIKAVVKDFYKRAHPDIYLESSTDNQGWLRVWVTRKMMEDLNLYGKQSF